MKVSVFLSTSLVAQDIDFLGRAPKPSQTLGEYIYVTRNTHTDATVKEITGVPIQLRNNIFVTTIGHQYSILYLFILLFLG